MKWPLGFSPYSVFSQEFGEEEEMNSFTQNLS